MQLRISLAAATVLAAMAAQAEDYVSVQYLQYDENKDRTSISAPSIAFNKDFGTDYTLNVSLVRDAVSGASETYYDADSGASAFSRGKGVSANKVTYDNVDYEETRMAGAISLTTRFANRDELTTGLAYSSESDFYSKELSTEYMHWLDSGKNSSVSFGLSYQANEILVQCQENGVSTCDAGSGASQAKTADALNAQISYFQNINMKSYFKASLFYIGDDGYLTNPYSNVVRNYDTLTNTADIVGEVRPDTRVAYGTALKYTNALTSNLSTHLNYRYYSDDWDIDSHTLGTDLYYQFKDDWIFNFGLRYYVQSEANFYNENKDYFTTEKYASSDKRLSDFDAMNYKLGVDYAISETININFNVNYYEQSTDLSATYFTTGLTYKF